MGERLVCPTCSHEFARPIHVRFVIDAAGYVVDDIVVVDGWSDIDSFGPEVTPGPTWPWSGVRTIQLCRFGSEDCEWVPA